MKADSTPARASEEPQQVPAEAELMPNQTGPMQMPVFQSGQFPFPLNAPSSNTLYLPIFHDINADLAKVIVDTVNARIANNSLQKLYIPISCGGGSVASALAIYEYLCSLEVEVITHNVGVVDSAAVLVFLGGSKRYAVKGSSFLLHPIVIQAVVQNPSVNDADVLRETLSRQTVQYAQIVESKTRLNKAEVQKFMKETKAINEVEAKTRGFISEVRALPNPASL